MSLEDVDDEILSVINTALHALNSLSTRPASHSVSHRAHLVSQICLLERRAHDLLKMIEPSGDDEEDEDATDEPASQDIRPAEDDGHERPRRARPRLRDTPSTVGILYSSHTAASLLERIYPASSLSSYPP